MLWTIINEADVFYAPSAVCASSEARPSNPYSYIRPGYHLDNASLFGGIDNVDFNCCFSGNRTSSYVDFARVGKRTFGNIS